MTLRDEPSVWSYRADVGAVEGDVTGFDVEATDGSIGKIDESSHAAGQGYLVVDTRFLIFGKRRLIPAGVVERVDDTDGKVYVRMTKNQFKSAPDFDAQQRTDRDDFAA